MSEELEELLREIRALRAQQPRNDNVNIWKMVAGVMISAVITGIGSGLFFRVGTERDIASMKTQQGNNTKQITELAGEMRSFVQEQNRFFREQADLIADLRARLNALDYDSGK